MKSRTTWVLIAIIAFGFTVEMIRDAKPNYQSTEIRETINLDEETSYDLRLGNTLRPDRSAVQIRPNIEQYRRDRKAQINRLKNKRFREGQIAKIDFKHGKKKKKGKKVETKKAVKKNAKKDKKDDKKKKKKEEDKTESIAEEEIPKENDEDKKEEEIAEEQTPNNGGAVAAVAPAAGGVPGNQKPPIDRNLQEWLDILLPSPSFRETDRFINAFRLGQVQEADFYEVINEMLDDPRETMNILATRALAATPSVRSFDTIVSITNDNFPAKVIQNAAQSLSTYEKPQHLTTLQKVLTSNVETETKKVAISKIGILARDFTEVPGISDIDGNNNFVNPNAATLEEIFQSLLASNFSQEDADLARVAKDLQDYLSDNFNFANS